MGVVSLRDLRVRQMSKALVPAVYRATQTFKRGLWSDVAGSPCRGIGLVEHRGGAGSGTSRNTCTIYR
jgi:hypothetical protein